MAAVIEPRRGGAVSAYPFLGYAAQPLRNAVVKCGGGLAVPDMPVPVLLVMPDASNPRYPAHGRSAFDCIRRGRYY